MAGLSDLAKLMVWAGVALIGMGAVIWLLGKATGGSGALLPGDIVFRRGHFSVYFPIVTCLLLSAALTLILHIVAALRR